MRETNKGDDHICSLVRVKVTRPCHPKREGSATIVHRKIEYELTNEVIMKKLWPDGTGTKVKVQKAVGRLRDLFKENPSIRIDYVHWGWVQAVFLRLNSLMSAFVSAFIWPNVIDRLFLRLYKSILIRSIMKKFTIIILSVGFLVSAFCWSRSNQKVELNPLLLDNIEALASNESAQATYCYGSGSVDCPITHTKVEYVIKGYGLK